ncbi:MAG: pyridoxine 5'-phosphate synthase [Candidatus Omnitrophota bacterium]|nr:pyridoxine 5'-phosphate synthase [Candidatus Omnitrophota bacterium]
MRLGVNVDHVATVRQARRGRLPDPVEAARLCERAGAQGIVCHLREDRRHIQEDDVKRLRKTLTTRLNLEMSIARDVVRAALAIQPHQVTLVPERRQELTTEGGLDVVRARRSLAPLIRSFQRQQITVSLFVDPVPTQLKAAQDVGAAMVELHTGRYANAGSRAERVRALDALRRAAQASRAFGLSVAAGHGLDYHNVSAVARLPELEELNIGFSIISRALFVGLEQAVREMVERMHRRPSHVFQHQAA